MSQATVSELVEAAARGDSGAFDQLVLRFQDMAVGTAYGWLRDAAQAEDVAQEAFVEVHGNIGRIRDPAAFPGFLRRAVLKHCDRRTRRRRREVPARNAGAGIASAEPFADASLALAEEHAHLRAAVEGLPAPQRLVVALHYLAGLSQSEVATWLELPLSTVKKRLHTARERLRDAMENHMDETLDALRSALRPSRDSRFSDTLRFFLAVREGSVDQVRSMLENSPELAEAEERWDAELTRAEALPVATGGTPLIRAAQRNHVALIDLLLDHGAQIDRSCPCAGGESALWAAVASGQVDATRHLLERGADPNHASFADHTPLHVAALRGFGEIAELLCGHGADNTRRDSRGRTASDWAAHKGHSAIAARLSDGSSSTRKTDAQTAESGAPVAPFGLGIKALDLLAPIFPGSLGYARFDSGLGTVVFLAELTTRWHQRALVDCPAVIWVGWEHQSVDRSEMEHAFAELGLEARAMMVWSPASDAEEERRRTMERAAAEARALQRRGVAHPLIVAFVQRGRRAELEAGLPGLRDGDGARITTIVAERGGDPAEDAAPRRSPFDVRLVFDPALAALGHFPALHPLRSESSDLTMERVGIAHVQLVSRVRELLAAHRALVPDLGDGDPSKQTPDERRLVARARRLQAYLTQPFEVAESFTGEPVRELTVADTLADVRVILEGALDDTDLGRLVYKGSLDEILQTA